MNRGDYHGNVSEADWQQAANRDDVQHTLEVAVLDPTGAVLIESAPVKFFARRATIRREAR